MDYKMLVINENELKEYAFLQGFDINFTDYCAVNDVRGDKVDPLLHYIKNWRKSNLVIPDEFNTYEYLHGAKDVLYSGENPLLHYLSVGIYEGRSPHLTEAMDKESFYNIHSILNCYIDDKKVPYFKLTVEELNVYIKFHKDVPLYNRVCEALNSENCSDSLLYIILNYDVSDMELKLSEHELVSLLLEQDRSKVATLDEITFNVELPESAGVDTNGIDAIIPESLKLEYERVLNLQLDWSGFLEKNKLDIDIDPIVYYLVNWKGSSLELNEFNTKFYLDTYPDVASAGMNPLLHYFEAGVYEGRLGGFQALIDAHYISGARTYKNSLPTIAIVCHESSATGAPLVGLNLGLSICEKYNVIHIVLHESNLQNEFVSNSIFTLSHLRHKDIATIQMLIKWLDKKFQLDSIICNSVETYPVLEAACQLNIPIISLLHEFSEYTRPRGKITNTIIHSNKVIVPAKIIADSACKEMAFYFGIKNKPNNLVVLPQGKLPVIPESNGSNFTVDELRHKFDISKSDKVIVGAGYVQTRKGVDLFIETAYKIKKQSRNKCKFIWVGGGFDPDWDIACSVWLQSQLDEYGLQEDFHFLSHQKSLDDVFSLADVYLLTSRLDPFPNVVIDALQADLPVVCFDRTTGCAEFLKQNKSNSAVVPFLDTNAMAKKTINFLTTQTKKLGINRQLVKDKLCFKNYVNNLIDIIEECKFDIKQRKKIGKTIADSNFFNVDFYNNGNNIKSAIEYYVKTALNGIHSSSPMPGFSVGKWFEDNQPKSNYIVPLYEQIKSGQKISTHECIKVTGACQKVSTKKVAVHLHLYYFDLASDFATYFSCLPNGFDLYITVCQPHMEDKVKAAFANIGANKVDVIEVDNIGRDVAPFFISLKDKVYKQGYEIVGHFHSKKSNDVDQGTGDRWRKYLLENLIGSNEAINDIFEPFENDDVGLVFTEDCHNIDFGKNKAFSDDLCDAMSINRLKTATLFPLGTMFWAKPEALSPLFDLNMTDYLQQEPLPYDGSYMHATERLISHVVTQTGFKFKTVYTQGTNW
jgi:glycosyltransferase involved in cell wall biosynthesis